MATLLLTHHSVGASRLFQVLPIGPTLNALCIHVTLLPSSEDEALPTISNLEHLKLCHTLGPENPDTMAALIKLLVQSMGTLKSLEFRAEYRTYTYLFSTRERILPEAGLIRFPRLESLSLFSIPSCFESRADMPRIWAEVCEGIDYSQLTSMSVYISKHDLTILNAQIAANTPSRCGLQLQDLSIDLHSTAHLNFLSSFDSLVTARLDNSSGNILTDTAVAAICRHNGLQHLKLCRDALGHFMDPVGPALRTIFQSLPLLYSFTFTSASAASALNAPRATRSPPKMLLIMRTSCSSLTWRIKALRPGRPSCVSSSG